MNDTEYLKQMIAINDYMQRLAERGDIDSEDFLEATNEIQRVYNVWLHSRRRQAWYRLASHVVLACVLAWSFYKVLCWLEI